MYTYLGYGKIILNNRGSGALFGYIKIDKNSLSEQEYEQYRALYCSLCRQLGKDYSVFARMILSFDCTFYALLIMSLSAECPEFAEGRCRFNPTKKCSYCISDRKALSQAAALSVSSAYFKLIDNINDSKWYKRLFYRILKPVFSRWRNKAKEKYPFIDSCVEKMMIAQQKVESDACCDIDRAAHPTATMLSEICEGIPESFHLKQSFDKQKQKRILNTFGYFLGRWIYLMDAADDFEKDLKSGSFNPFVVAGYSKEDLEEHILPILNHSLSEILLSYSLLDECRYDAIISNTLYSACVKIQKNILSKYTDQPVGEKNEESI